MRTRTRRPGQVRRAARVLAANAAVLAALLLAGEALVRLLAPGIVPAGADDALFTLVRHGSGAAWALRPGATGESYGVRIAVGPDGTQRYDAETDTDTTAAQWLLLGDSVTMGLGVAPDATFAGRLAARPGLRVLNPSVLGWAAPDYRRAAAAALVAVDAGQRRAPDAVTIVWCLNDLYPDGQPVPLATAAATAAAAPRATLGQRAFQLAKSAGAGPLAWLNRRSRLYRWARTVPTDAAGRTYGYDRALYTDAARQPDRDRAFAEIATIRDTLAARGVPFTVALVPESPQVGTGDAAPQDTLRARFAALGVRTLDLAPVLDRAEHFLTGDATHLSPSGHAAAAAALRALAP